MNNGGFTLDGTSATTLNLYMVDGPGNPILPPTRDRTVEVSGRNGAYDFGADFGPRPITIPCAFLYASDAFDLAAHVQTLAEFLVSNGKPKQMELIFDDLPTKRYSVRYAGTLPLTRTVFDGSFELRLVAHDPFPKPLPNPIDPTAEDAEAYGWTWTVTGEEAEITAYDTEVGGLDVVMPDSIDGYPVTSFSDLFMFHYSDIESVSVSGVPDTLPTFFASESLHTAVIRDGVTALPDSMFRNCYALATVEWPTDSLLTIGNGAFRYCPFVSVQLPHSVTFVDSVAFANNNLETFCFGAGITSLGEVFSNNPALANVYFHGDEPTVSSLHGTNVPFELTHHIIETKTWSVTPPDHWEDRATAYWTP